MSYRYRSLAIIKMSHLIQFHLDLNPSLTHFIKYLASPLSLILSRLQPKRYATKRDAMHGIWDISSILFPSGSSSYDGSLGRGHMRENRNDIL